MVTWCRKVMNEETIALVSALPTASMTALEISGDTWATRCRWKSYRSVHYPQFDLNFDTMQDASFDFIVAEQVLEHVKYPYRSVRNVYSMLNIHGWFLVTTPFLIQIHHYGMDYTRWTPKGLAYLLEECGFASEHIKTNAWGNRSCIIADLNSCAEGRGWNQYLQGKHSLENEPRYPVVVWAIAQKV
jgi:hypothetical protein